MGAGATTFRTKTYNSMLSNLQISILKGNSGEIGVLAGEDVEVKGVDSVHGVKHPSNVVLKLANLKSTLFIDFSNWQRLL